MNGKSMAMAALVGAMLALPSPVWAQHAFHLRNETRQTHGCRLHRPHSEAAERFSLRPGQSIHWAASDETSRRLVCDIGRSALIVQLRPGYNYAIIVDPETRRVAIQIAPLR